MGEGLRFALNVLQRVDVGAPALPIWHCAWGELAAMSAKKDIPRPRFLSPACIPTHFIFQAIYKCSSGDKAR